MSSEWRNDLPPKEGYYEAKFGANDTPRVVYLHPFKAGEISGIDEDFITWGWDETDDPESVELECERGDFWWREIQLTHGVETVSRLPTSLISDLAMASAKRALKAANEAAQMLGVDKSPRTQQKDQHEQK